MTFKYPKIWVIVCPASMNSRADRIYGPFRTPEAAASWAEKFRFIVPWTITLMDTPGSIVASDATEIYMTFDLRGDE